MTTYPQKSRGVPVYLELGNKMANFDSFPNEIQVVLAEYCKLKNSMDVEPTLLNVVKGREPKACFRCRTTPGN